MSAERVDPVYDAAETIVMTLQPARASVGHIGTVTRALRALFGEPTVDRVLGTPLRVWDVLRDVQTRLGRLEGRAFEGDGAERVRAALRDEAAKVLPTQRIMSGKLVFSDGRELTITSPLTPDGLADLVRLAIR